MGDVLYAATHFRTRPIRDESRQSPATVLLVDPDPATLAAMDQALSDEGFVTATAFDGPGAVAASYRVGPVDALVACAYKSTSAVELADALRRLHPGLVVLYTTAPDDELFAERLVLSSDEEVIEKPFSGGELVDAVSSLLR